MSRTVLYLFFGTLCTALIVACASVYLLHDVDHNQIGHLNEAFASLCVESILFAIAIASTTGVLTALGWQYAVQRQIHLARHSAFFWAWELPSSNTPGSTLHELYIQGFQTSLLPFIWQPQASYARFFYSAKALSRGTRSLQLKLRWRVSLIGREIAAAERAVAGTLALLYIAPTRHSA